MMKAEVRSFDDYRQYRLPTMIATEQSFLGLQGEVEENKERAFVIANKGLPAIEQGKIDEAERMSYHALSLDPLCIDAWRMLCKVLNQNCDGDTIVCAIREVLSFCRPFFKEEFETQAGNFYQLAHTRPYIRLLTDMGKTALRGDQLDVAIYAYEECLRLNHHDNMLNRDPLLCCYIKLIGRLHRHPKTTKPKRTIAQVEQFIDSVLYDDVTTFNKDTLTVRWAQICLAYIKKQNWQKLAKEEYSKDDHIFKVLFEEIKIQRLPPPNLEMPNGFIIGSKMAEVRAYGYIKEDWPDLLIDLRRLFRGKVTPQLAEDIRLNAPNPDNDLHPLYKQQAYKDGEAALAHARSALAARNFSQAVTLFTFAKNGFDEASLPSRRWYYHSPFAIASNRATAACQLKMWNLLRIDSRFTLLMKPDHDRTYLRLPIIAKAFGAKQLDDEFYKIAKKVADKQVNDYEDWKKLAKVAIGLLSLPAIAFAACGKLTQEMKDKLIEVGIENMYVTVNVEYERSILPWLTKDDFEPPIPDE